MSKTTKIRRNYKSKRKNKKNGGKNDTTNTLLKAISYKEYILQLKESKKYSESLEYLKIFSENLEDDSVIWKFKSNLQKFIKKHILLKDLFGSESFKSFQQYFFKMVGKEEFLKVCEEVVRKINENDKKIVYDILTKKIEPLEEEEYEKLAEKIKNRCIILVENN